MELSLRPLSNATLSPYSGFASAGNSRFPPRGSTASAAPRTGCRFRTGKAADAAGGSRRRVALEPWRRRRQFWIDERESGGEEGGGESSSRASDDDDEALLLSLSEKPDRSTALLDEYGMEELDYASNPDHRSGYVAVLGKPNVGKSTLANQMIGQKLSIVTDKPQTTRHRVLGICSGPEYQMILYDTPGVIEKKMHKLDSMMMSNVRSAAINADCVLVLVDACKVPEKIDEVLEEGIQDLKNKVPTLLVMNKKDLIKPGEIAKKLQWYEKFTDADDVIPVSAKFGHGVEDVKDWILSKLPLGPAYYPKDIVSEHPERFFVAEIVREKIFMQYRNEIPYASQVNVVSYKTRPNAKDFIQVEIVVEKNSQKIIVIGKVVLSTINSDMGTYSNLVGLICLLKQMLSGRTDVFLSFLKDYGFNSVLSCIMWHAEGRALKLLATAARLDIEDFLQKKVYLEVEVKVKENWRQDEGLLKYYGYGGQIRVL